MINGRAVVHLDIRDASRMAAGGAEK